jgi:hypothetical protein
VTDLASAQQALDTILEQGEGARGHWETAHFGEFVQILADYRGMLVANPAFDPVRPVLFAKVRRGEHDDLTPLIGDRLTQCTDLFNVSYEILERYFAHTDETDAQLATRTTTSCPIWDPPGRCSRSACAMPRPSVLPSSRSRRSRLRPGSDRLSAR